MNSHYITKLGLVVLALVQTSTALSKSQRLGQPVYSQPHYEAPNNIECANQDCEAASEQAKTLSKLSVLDEYVDQTMILLHDLMKSYESELLRSATRLKSKTNRDSCPQVHTMLEQIIRDHKARAMKQSSLSQELGQGMSSYSDDHEDKKVLGTSVDGSASTTWTSSSVTTNNGGDYYDRYPSQGKASGENFEDYDENINNPWATTDPHGKHFEGKNTGEEKDRYGKGYYKTDRGYHQSSSSIYDRSHYGGQFSEGPYEKEGGSNYDGKEAPKEIFEHEKSHSHKSTISLSSDNSSECRGVGKDQPHWVPNLDSWCQYNCPRGYCPSTHCIC